MDCAVVNKVIDHMDNVLLFKMLLYLKVSEAKVHCTVHFRVYQGSLFCGYQISFQRSTKKKKMLLHTGQLNHAILYEALIACV